MFKKEKNALSDITDALSREKTVLQIVAYGSRVRGDFTENSDFDVFTLVGEKNPTIKKKIRDVFYEFELKYDIPFNVTILSKKEYDFNVKLGSPYIKSIAEEGIIIYDAKR